MSDPRFTGVEACVFDAYGTLFDFNTAAQRSREKLGDKANLLSETWRQKQLQYTWLRSLMGRYVDFWHVTGEALDFAMEEVGLDDPALRAELMQHYLSVNAYPEVAQVLGRLKNAGLKVAILSNGSPTMLVSAVRSAEISRLVDHTISVHDAGIFKPHPSVYQLAVDRLKIPAAAICFVSSNGWDANAAAALGFRVVWANRGGQPAERIPTSPQEAITSLADLPALLGL